MASRTGPMGCLIAAMLAAPLFGCAQAQSRVVGFINSNRAARGDGLEKTFSVQWWARPDPIEVVPFKPLESASPAGDPATGRAFIATSAGKVVAFDQEGKLLWEYLANGPFFAGPEFDGEQVFVSTTEGKLVALDAATGAKQWEYGAGDELVTQPVVTEELVLAMGVSETLYAVDRKTGAWRWQYRRDKPTGFTLHGAARPLVVNGKVFAGFADGYAVALSASEGSVLWTKELASVGQFVDVDADPVMDDWGRVYFASNASGVWALDGETGDSFWNVPRRGVTALELNPSQGWLFAGGQGFVGSFETDTALPRWILDLGDERFVSGLARADGFLLAATGSGPLLFLDERDGALRRAFNPGHGIAARPATSAAMDAVVLSNRGFVYSLALEPAGRL